MHCGWRVVLPTQTLACWLYRQVATLTVRGVLALAACLSAGSVLFFLMFGAIFSGLWSLMIATALLYVAAGAVGASVGRINARPVVTALIAPSVPVVLWLFAASVSEAGLARASLWPLGTVVLAGLAWVGAALAVQRRSRSASLAGTPADLQQRSRGEDE